MRIWFNWGSNPGPSPCGADVIATTLLNQLILFQGGRTPTGRWFVDNKQFTVKWCFGSTDVRTQYLLWVEQTWLRLHYWTRRYYSKEGRLLLWGDMWIMNCKTMIWFNCGSNPGPSACEADVIATTLLNQLMVFQGGKTPTGRSFVDNKQFTVKWRFGSTGVRTQYLLWVRQMW